MKLHFIVPGFSKCGTTTVCSLLSKHPDLFIPQSKEPNYFAHNYKNGWPYYRGLFAEAGETQLLGEGSTTYSTGEFAQLASGRILEQFPEVRFIFLVRNPVKRLESSYRELHHNGHRYLAYADWTIGKTLREFPNMIQDTLYWKQINVYRRRVPENRILVVFLEDFQKHPESEMTRCFEFLEVDPTVQVENANRKLNTATSKRYDSRLMRYIRTHRWSSRIWEHLSERDSERLARLFGLRKRFQDPLPWDAESRRWLLDQIREDSLSFLRFYGKPDDFWDLDKAPCAGRKAA